MSIFGKILSKIGLGKAKAEEAPAVDITSEEKADAAAADPAVQPLSDIDVLKQLEDMAAGQNLNWKTSIVDLMKLLGLDSSYGERKELARELNCPAEKMEDSAQMNIWLHKQVLKKLAENGGNIPADLLD